MRRAMSIIFIKPYSAGYALTAFLAAGLQEILEPLEFPATTATMHLCPSQPCARSGSHLHASGPEPRYPGSQHRSRERFPLRRAINYPCI
jgi:hypothetical protein